MHLLRFGPPFGDDSSYFKALEKEWALGVAFINVEHDIEATSPDLFVLAACPHDWCAAPYPYLDRPQQFGLGLVKFSADLIARNPRMFEEIGTWSNSAHPPQHWCTLDAWTYRYLIARGEKRCETHSLVGHVGHPGKLESSHGCFSIRNT